MRLSKERKGLSFLAILCAIALWITSFDIPVFAATEKKITVTANQTIQQGDVGYCYVYIDSTEGLSSLDVTVYYDSSKIKMLDIRNRVSVSKDDYLQTDSSLQFTYRFEGEKTSQKTNLILFTYIVRHNAEVGDTYFDVEAKNACDESQNSVQVNGYRHNLIIAPGIGVRNCRAYATNGVYITAGKEFELNYQLDTYKIGSGAVQIRYDPELVELVSVTNGNMLTDMMVDVNTSIPGIIYVAFVGTEYSGDKSLLTVNFRTLKNVETKTYITFTSAEFYDLDLNFISCNEFTTTINLMYDNTHTEDTPVMRLDGTFSAENNQIIMEVLLDKNSHLGAGDFVIKFDPKLVTYSSCSKGFSPSFFNVNDKNVDTGELSFHIISLSDIVTKEKVLTVVFNVNDLGSDKMADFTLKGSGLTDSLSEKILLEFVGDAVPVEWEVEMTSIEITQKPTKLTYLEGDSLDLSGMVVMAYYSNGTSKVITDYTVSGDISTLGNKAITVSYGGKIASFTVTVTSDVPSSITSLKYTIQNGNISKIIEGTTVTTLLSGINEGAYCKVYKGNSVVSGDTVVGTGMVVKLMDGNTVRDACTIVVTGDTNGDGSISVTDMIAIKAHVLKKTLLTEASAMAADTNGDGGISVTDFIQVKAKILKKGTITAR